MVDSSSIKVLYCTTLRTNVFPRPWTSYNFLPLNFFLDTPNHLDFSFLNWYSPIAHAQLAVTRNGHTTFSYCGHQYAIQPRYPLVLLTLWSGGAFVCHSLIGALIDHI